MNKKMKWHVIAMIAIGFACAANARVQVQVPAVLDRSAPIADSVRAECNVPQLVGQNVSDIA